jgi:GT2 family glycosyltransferase
MSESEESAKPAPLLSCIVITFRRPRSLMATLDALRHQTRVVDHLIVVDNDASPAIKELVETSGFKADVEYVAMPENLGPAGAFGAGLQRALNRADDGDWLLLVDDGDPPRTPTAVASLFEFARRTVITRPALGGVGIVGGRLDRRYGAMHRLTDSELAGEAIDVDYLGGGQLPVYRVGALRRSGPPEAGLFFGWDDLDLALRLAREGFTLVAHGDLWREARVSRGRWGLSARQSRAASERMSAPWRRYYSDRNWVFLLRGNGAWTGAVVATLRIVTAGIWRLVRSRGRSWAEFRASMTGLVDGWCGRIGKTREPDVIEDLAPSRD